MKWHKNANKWLLIAPPYIWLLIFLLLPLLLTLKISLSVAPLGSEAFEPILRFTQQTMQITLNLRHYITLMTHHTAIIALISSLKVAAITTLCCAIIGYPIAYTLARAHPRYQNILLILIILPYWISLLLRTYAWIHLLQRNGLINQFLIHLGITHMPLPMIYNNFSLYTGLIYGYLPFFILPLYPTLAKMDPAILEAAYDLGAHPWRAFTRITLPLSRPGIIAGALLVFIPCVGEVIIPQLLGGLDTIMIGNVIWQEFFVANNWGYAAALSIMMILLLIVPIMAFGKLHQKPQKARS